MGNVKVIYNKLLRGWYIVRGPHHTPIGGRFETRGDAIAHLEYRRHERDRHARRNASMS